MLRNFSTPVVRCKVEMGESLEAYRPANLAYTMMNKKDSLSQTK